MILIQCYYKSSKILTGNQSMVQKNFKYKIFFTAFAFLIDHLPFLMGFLSFRYLVDWVELIQLS